MLKKVKYLSCVLNILRFKKIILYDTAVSGEFNSHLIG